MYSDDWNLGYILISEVEGFSYFRFSGFGWIMSRMQIGIWNENIVNDHKVLSCCIYRWEIQEPDKGKP